MSLCLPAPVWASGPDSLHQLPRAPHPPIARVTVTMSQLSLPSAMQGTPSRTQAAGPRSCVAPGVAPHFPYPSLDGLWP